MFSHSLFTPVRAAVILETFNRFFKKFTFNEARGSKPGDNYSAILFRFEVKGIDHDDVELMRSFIVKCCPKTEKREQFLTDFFGREVCIFKTVIPSFVSFGESRNVKAAKLNNLPIYYNSSLAYGDEVVVMEDMAVKGFEMARVVDYDHCTLVLQQLAKFHSYSFAMKALQPEKFEEISKLDEVLFYNKDSWLVKQFSGKITEWSALLDNMDLDQGFMDRYKAFVENLGTVMTECTDAKNGAHPYEVIAHGDCWINNFLFKYSDGVPLAICQIDFQVCRTVSPALDIAYFMYCATEHALREKCYDELIAKYHENLGIFLKEFGCDVEKCFPLEVLHDHLKKFTRFGVGMALIGLKHMMSNGKNNRLLSELLETADDDKTKEFDPELDERFRRRFKDVVVDYFSLNCE